MEQDNGTVLGVDPKMWIPSTKLAAPSSQPVVIAEADPNSNIAPFESATTEYFQKWIKRFSANTTGQATMRHSTRMKS